MPHNYEKDDIKEKLSIRDQYDLYDDSHMDKGYKVAICLPTYDMKVNIRTMISLATMWKPNHYYKYKYGPTIDVNRNVLVQEALLDEGTTHILFVDTDMIIPHNLLGRFLLHMEDDKTIDVMSGIYFQRDIPFRSTQFLEWGDEFFKRLRAADYPEGALVDIDAAGAGALLIKRDVFDKIKQPHFEFLLLNYGCQYLGEDITFFKKMKEAGLRTCVDTSIICQHIGAGLIVPLVFERGFLELGEATKMMGENKDLINKEGNKRWYEA
ncbi:hypothetical protein E3J84_03950 [Candidatus Aerophobetes bacterium]|uniref:Glycosyltransferase 2-like domain-containing protein n=1 Tax=Aerophobetes bacterium TaxID=2030807 RepID=A0A523RXI8_UNCAE|nr:MAG: hypothetical protein E3J84_03950 [Candidatus Aerophobetes bacterium]